MIIHYLDRKIRLLRHAQRRAMRATIATALMFAASGAGCMIATSNVAAYFLTPIMFVSAGLSALSIIALASSSAQLVFVRLQIKRIERINF